MSEKDFSQPAPILAESDEVAIVGCEFSAGHDWEGFPGGCARFGCAPGCSETAYYKSRIAKLEAEVARLTAEMADQPVRPAPVDLAKIYETLRQEWGKAKSQDNPEGYKLVPVEQPPEVQAEPVAFMYDFTTESGYKVKDFVSRFIGSGLEEENVRPLYFHAADPVAAKLAEALRNRLALMDAMRNHPPMHADSYHQALAETEEAMRSALDEYDKTKGGA